MSSSQSTLTRYEVRVDALQVGDMREIGRDCISRIYSIGPYYEYDELPMWNGREFVGGRLKQTPSERYITIDNIDPPKRRDELVMVWR